MLQRVADTLPAPGWDRWFDLMFPDVDEIRDYAPLAQPVLLIAALNLTAAAAIRPAIGVAFGSDANIASNLQAWLWITALLYPLLGFLKCAALAALAWATATLLDQDAHFRRLLSVFLFAELFLTLAVVTTAIVLHVRGLSSIAGPADLAVPLGIDLFFDVQSPRLQILAQSVTVFHVVWFGFLAYALPRAVRVRQSTAVAQAVAAWLLIIAIAAVRTVMV